MHQNDGYGSMSPEPMRKPRPLREREGSQKDIAILASVPWMTFTMLMFLVAFGLYHFSALVWTMVILVAAISCATALIGAIRKRGLYFTVGLFCLAEMLMAIGIGLYIDDSCLDDYFRLSEGAEYAQVSPDMKGESYADAKIITFVEQSFIDSDNSIGYMQEGVVYCVAPIASRSTVLMQAGHFQGNATRSVGFWAIGLDCCSARGGFTCDDATNLDAHSALVYDEKEEGFDQALRMQGAANNLIADDGAKFVRWVNDASELKSDFLSDGVTIACFASIIDCVMLVSIALAFASRIPKGGVAL